MLDRGQIQSSSFAEPEGGRAGHLVNWITIPASKAEFTMSEVDQIKQVSELMCATIAREFAGEGTKAVCYVTLASPDYEWGLRVLLRSLRKVSRVPVIIISARRWMFECEEPDVWFIEVPALVNREYRPNQPQYPATLTKLWVFGLTCFRRITFVDADCLFLRSVDDLFDAQGLVAGGDYVVDARPKGFNSGLFSFEPTPELRDLIFEEAKHAASFDGGDQGLLNELLRSRVRMLPPEYDLMRHFDHYGGIEFKRGETRMIHYIMKKPWELSVRELIDHALVELDDLWTNQLTRDELLALIRSWRRKQHFSVWDQDEYRRRRRTRRRTRALIIIGGILLALSFLSFGYFVGGGAWPR